MRTLLITLMAVWVLGEPIPLFAAEPVDYTTQIKPLLAARCYACHGSLKQKAKLRLDTVKAMVADRPSGPAIIPGKSGESVLIDLITETGEDRMPPPSEGEALSAAEVTLFKRWIDQGAVGPADDRSEPDPRDHWAFRPPVRPPVPAIDGPRKHPMNPIDAFLATEWTSQGLKPQPPASKELLQRRVYLDLIGLPPTAEERAAFLADKNPDAYEKLVDRLLDGRPHSERWARHWMDIWRYSDWWGLGAEVRNSQKHMWHWRDWLIESLAADLGYDQMVRDMLAADELAPDDPQRVRATGFLARGYFKFNRNTWLEDVVEHSGKAFLGLTINCAKCHDHKYDPISHQDYYRFRAFFEPYEVRLDQVPGQVDFEKDGIPRVYDALLDTPTYRFDRGNEAKPLKNEPLKPSVPAILAWGKQPEITPVKLPVEASMPGLRPFVLSDRLRGAEARAASALSELSKAKAGLSAENAADKPATERVEAAEKSLAAALMETVALSARAAADRARPDGIPADDAKRLAISAARAERLLALAKAEAGVALAEIQLAAKPDDKALKTARKAAAESLAAAKKALSAETDKYTPIRGAAKSPESPTDTEFSTLAVYPTVSTGRRTALANWLTDRKNPLTARVAVNHIWMRHFGAPLVPTVFDFGRKGTPPTHPELLDWLAVDFMEHGWSMKRLHRLIVTSDAYRRTSSAAGADRSTLAADPENRLYWRMNSRRMEAQVVRDSLLLLAGELLETQGGPSLPKTEEMIPRRSIYFVHSNNDHVKFLSTFDDADVLDCYRRAESVVPAQALALWNSKLAMTMGAKIANRLSVRLSDGSDSAFAAEAFQTLLATPPNPAELLACEETLTDLKGLLTKRGMADPGRKARELLVQSLLNHNDFITIR
jgi:hypothetical protein